MAKPRFSGTVLVALLFLFLIAVVAAIAALKFEFFKPEVHITPDFTLLGKEKDITVMAKDIGSGLKEIKLDLVQGGKEVEVVKQSFPKERFLPKGRIKECSVLITLRPVDAGLVDGQAILRVLVRDYSWWGWFSGNEQVLEKKVSIDTQTPTLSVLSRAHNVTLGGSGLVVYQTEGNLPVTGVVVGEKFYPGYPKIDGRKGVYVAYFAVPWDAPKDISLSLLARDEAGNTARVPVPYHIRRSRFRTDKITLSPEFLETKMPEFMEHYPDLKGSYDQVFLEVSHRVRVENDCKVAGFCSHSQPRPLWKGAFLRMPGAAPKGLFADQRTYFYEGQKIDTGIHLGIDLASTEHSPVQAANAGMVVYTGYLGIYGNTILIDHGQGIFSMYAHLSHISVAPKQMPEKGTILGYSGSSGLAGGDHLHFSILVGGTFVNPVEWWDEHWIRDNITLKLP